MMKKAETAEAAQAQGERPYAQALQRLRAANLRPTRQRLALVKILFEPGDRHVTAEALHGEAMNAGVRVSLATIYNALHQFTDAGLLRQVVVDGSRTYFDTNIDDHHHFYLEEDGSLMDIPGEGISVTGLPPAPRGHAARRVDVIVRVARQAEKNSK